MQRLDVDAMLDEMVPGQFDEWLAYDRLEPIGMERLHEQLALIGSSICRSNGMKVGPEHFRLKPDEPAKEKPLSVASQNAVFERIAARMGGG